jgi:hypothetical protein
MAAADPLPARDLPPFAFADLRGRPAPAAGELHVAPVNDADRCLARLVLRHGWEVLPRGDDPVTTIVVNSDPTLDDMLAATVVAVLRQRKAVPAGLRPFAEYAAAARQGFYPGNLPPDRSLIGFYKALRWDHDLTDPDGARRFNEAWKELAQVVFVLAADDVNPFEAFPLPTWQFPEARAKLAEDRAKYSETDKGRAESLILRLPDGGRRARPCPALLFRECPTSNLWKEWARSDPDAPRPRVGVRRLLPSLLRSRERGRAGYNFLGVDTDRRDYPDQRNWVFSTDPVREVRIDSLRDLLQGREGKLAPRADATNPWVVLYNGTLVAAPRGGTAIPDAEVLALVKGWGRARTPRPVRHLTAGAAVAVLGGVILACVLGAHRRASGDAPPPPAPVPVEVIEPGGVGGETWVPLTEMQPATGDERSAEVDLNVRPNRPLAIRFRPRLRAPQPVWLRIQVTLPEGGPPLTGSAQLTVNGRASESVSLDANPGPVGAGESQTARRPEFLRDGENAIEFRMTRGRPTEYRAQVRLTWDENRDYRPDLYLFAVGMGHYRSQNPLPFAETDPANLIEDFRVQGERGGPFNKVHVFSGKGPLLNPTRDQLLDKLQQFANLVNAAQGGSLAWVVISGHGVAEHGRFHVLTPGDQSKPDGRVSADDLAEKIDQIHGPVVLVLDTCDSGQVHHDLRYRMASANWGRVVISASYERAIESDRWKHSALCLATLEYLEGEYLLHDRRDFDHLPYYVQSETPWRTLRGFCAYVERRVEQLNKGREDLTRNRRVDVSKTPSLDLAERPFKIAASITGGARSP